MMVLRGYHGAYEGVAMVTTGRPPPLTGAARGGRPRPCCGREAAPVAAGAEPAPSRAEPSRSGGRAPAPWRPPAPASW